MELSNNFPIIKSKQEFIPQATESRQRSLSPTFQSVPSYDFNDDQPFPSSGLGPDDYLNERFHDHFCNQYGEIICSDPFDINNELKDELEKINYHSFPHNNDLNRQNSGIRPSRKAIESHVCKDEFIPIDFIPLLRGLKDEIGSTIDPNHSTELIGGAVPFLLAENFYISYIQKRDPKSINKSVHYSSLYSKIIKQQPNDFDCRLWIKKNHFFAILDPKSFQATFARMLSNVIRTTQNISLSPNQIQNSYFEKIQLIRNESLFLAMAGFGSFSGSPMELVIRLLDDKNQPIQGRPFLFTKDQSALALHIINNQIRIDLKFYHFNQNEPHSPDETTLFHQINLILDTPSFDGMNWRGWICAMGLSTKWWRSLKPDFVPKLWRCLEEEKKNEEESFLSKELIDAEISWFEINHLANPNQSPSLFNWQQIAFRWNIWIYLIDRKKLNSDDLFYLPLQVVRLLENSNNSIPSPYGQNMITTLLNLILSKEIVDMPIETKLAWFRLTMWLHSSMIGQPIGSISTNYGEKSYRISLSTDDPAVIWMTVAIDQSIDLILESIKNKALRNDCKSILEPIFSLLSFKSSETLYRFHHREKDQLLKLSNELKLSHDPKFLLLALRIDQALIQNNKLTHLPTDWINLLPQFLIHYPEELDSFLDLFQEKNRFLSSFLKLISKPTLQTILSPIDWNLYLLNSDQPEMIKAAHKLLIKLDYRHLTRDTSTPDELLKGLQLDLELIKITKEESLSTNWLELLPRLIETYPSQLATIHQKLPRIQENHATDAANKIDSSSLPLKDLNDDPLDPETVLDQIEWPLYLLQSRLKGGVKEGLRLFELIEPEIIHDRIEKIDDPKQLLTIYKYLHNLPRIERIFSRTKLHSEIYALIEKKLPRDLVESIKLQNHQIDLIPWIFFMILVKGEFLGCKIEPKNQKFIHITIELDPNFFEQALQAENQVQIPIEIDLFISEAIKAFKKLDPIICCELLTAGSTLDRDKLSFTNSLQRVAPQLQKNYLKTISQLINKDLLSGFLKSIKESDPTSPRYQIFIYLGLLLKHVTKKNYIFLEEWLVEYPKIDQFHSRYKEEVKNLIFSVPEISNQKSTLRQLVDQNNPIDPYTWMIELISHDYEPCQTVGITLRKKTPLDQRPQIERDLIIKLREKLPGKIKEGDPTIQKKFAESLQRLHQHSILLSLPQQKVKEQPFDYLQRILSEFYTNTSTEQKPLPNINSRSNEEIHTESKQAVKSIPKTHESTKNKKKDRVNSKSKNKTQPSSTQKNKTTINIDLKQSLNQLIENTLNKKDALGIDVNIDSIINLIQGIKEIPTSSATKILTIFVKFKITNLNAWVALIENQKDNNAIKNDLRNIFSKKNNHGIKIFGPDNILFLVDLLLKMDKLFEPQQLTQIVNMLIPANSKCNLYAIRAWALKKLNITQKQPMTLNDFSTNLNNKIYSNIDFYDLRETLLLDLLDTLENNNYRRSNPLFVNKSIIHTFRLSVRHIYNQYGEELCHDLFYGMGYYLNKELLTSSLQFYIAACRELCKKNNLFFCFADPLQDLIKTSFDAFARIQNVNLEQKSLVKSVGSFEGLSELFDLLDEIWNQGDLEKIKLIESIYDHIAPQLEILRRNFNDTNLTLKEPKLNFLHSGILLTNYKSWLRYFLMRLEEFSAIENQAERQEKALGLLALKLNILDIFYHKIEKADAKWFYSRFFLFDKEANELFDYGNFLDLTPNHSISQVYMYGTPLPRRHTYLIEMNDLNLSPLGKLAYHKFTLHQFFHLFYFNPSSFKQINKYIFKFNIFTKAHLRFQLTLQNSNENQRNGVLLAFFYDLVKNKGHQNKWLMNEIDLTSKISFFENFNTKQEIENIDTFISHIMRHFPDQAVASLGEFYRNRIELYLNFKIKHPECWIKVINQLIYFDDHRKILFQLYTLQYNFGLDLLGEEYREFLVSIFRQLYSIDRSHFHDTYESIISTLIPKRCSNPNILIDKAVIEHIRNQKLFVTTNVELTTELQLIWASICESNFNPRVDSLHSTLDRDTCSNDDLLETMKLIEPSDDIKLLSVIIPNSIANLNAISKIRPSLNKKSQSMEIPDKTLLAQKFISACNHKFNPDKNKMFEIDHSAQFITELIFSIYDSETIKFTIDNFLKHFDTPIYLVPSCQTLVQICLSLTCLFTAEPKDSAEKKNLFSLIFYTSKNLFKKIKELIKISDLPDLSITKEFISYLNNEDENLQLLFELLHGIHTEMDLNAPETKELLDFYNSLIPIFNQGKRGSTQSHRLLNLLKATYPETWLFYMQYIHAEQKNNLKNIKMDMKNILNVEQGLFSIFPTINLTLLNRFYVDFFKFSYWKSPYFKEKFISSIKTSKDTKAIVISNVWTLMLSPEALKNYVPIGIESFKTIFSIPANLFTQNTQQMHANRFHDFMKFLQNSEDQSLWTQFQVDLLDLAFYAMDKGWEVVNPI